MKKTEYCVRFMVDKGLSIATAESCTGGMIAEALVNVPGVSACYKEGYIAYANESKHKLLHVRNRTLSEHGAVSVETAREMAHGARRSAGADIGIASTGIAGPGGGTEEKPVGLVYLSCAIGHVIVTRKFLWKGNRFWIRFQSARAAMNLLYDCIRLYGETL